MASLINYIYLSGRSAVSALNQGVQSLAHRLCSRNRVQNRHSENVERLHEIFIAHIKHQITILDTMKNPRLDLATINNICNDPDYDLLCMHISLLDRRNLSNDDKQLLEISKILNESIKIINFLKNDSTNSSIIHKAVVEEYNKNVGPCIKQLYLLELKALTLPATREEEPLEIIKRFIKVQIKILEKIKKPTLSIHFVNEICNNENFENLYEQVTKIQRNELSDDDKELFDISQNFYQSIKLIQLFKNEFHTDHALYVHSAIEKEYLIEINQNLEKAKYLLGLNEEPTPQAAAAIQLDSDPLDCSEQDKDNIERIITLSSDKTTYQLMTPWTGVELYRLGQSVMHVHPLEFLTIALKGHNLEKMRNIFQDSTQNFWKKDSFMNGSPRLNIIGLSQKLDSKMRQNGQLDVAAMNKFAAAMRVDVAEIQGYFEGSNWEGLIQHFLPRD